MEPLFDQKTLNRLSQDIKLSSKQQEAAKTWIEWIKSGKLEEERANYIRFASKILESILGYPVSEDLEFESQNVEFSFKDSDGRPLVCIEAKGSKQDLFSKQGRSKKEYETPISQTWSYMIKDAFPFGITTNYRTFVLSMYAQGSKRLYEFDFLQIEDEPSRLQEFVAVFSKHTLEQGFVERIYEESTRAEREFTDEFYKLYHETRLMFYQEFKQNVTPEGAIHFAQLFLNRLMFVFFAQGTGLMSSNTFEERIEGILTQTSLFSSSSNNVRNVIVQLFKDCNEGSDFNANIPSFNGGLFKHTVPDKITFPDIRPTSFFQNVLTGSKLKKKDERFLKREEVLTVRFSGKLNPLISNLLYLSSFDFRSEISVNILGHVFEQSIEDLETIHEQKEKSKKKKDGIFYTPEYITDYICRNTIIPALSDANARTVGQLVREHEEDITVLEKKLRNLRVLDPACGSGAFLIKAAETLLEIHEAILLFKEATGEYDSSLREESKRWHKKAHKQTLSLDKWRESTEARRIVKENLFGVDINEESVEITKLSLFLRIAEKNRQLVDLSENIKQGNSLINDESIDNLAFDWDLKFPKIMADGRFDVIIGNPPYVRMEEFKEIKQGLQKYQTHSDRADLYVYFYEKAWQLLREGGIAGYISNNTFFTTKYGVSLREFLLRKTTLREVLNLGETQFFEGATTYPTIITFQRTQPSREHKFAYLETTKIEAGEFNREILKAREMVPQLEMPAQPWIALEGESMAIFNKISSHKSLCEAIGSPKMGIKSGLKIAFEVDEETYRSMIRTNRDCSRFLKPLIVGSDCERWLTPRTDGYLIYIPKGTPEASIPQPILEHLAQYRDRLEKRATEQEWYALQQPQQAYIDSFESAKIIYNDISNEPRFSFDEGSYLNNAVYFIPGRRYELLSILNSKVVYWFISKVSRGYRGGYITFRNVYVEQIPIPNFNDDMLKSLGSIAQSLTGTKRQILEIRQKFSNMIRRKLTKPMGRNLERFWLLSERSFIDDMKKRTSFTRSELEEISDDFRDSSVRLQHLYRELASLEAKNDQLVADAYGLEQAEYLSLLSDLKQS